jgi:hypothetical protein
MPHPINLVIIAIATIKPARNNTLRLIPLRSTCAPMIAKNKGAKILSNLDPYSPICLITLVLATAMPTENAPTIGDSPINAAIPANPKKAAVVIPSTLPSERYNLSTCSIRGINMTNPTSKTTNNPRIFRIKNVIS